MSMSPDGRYALHFELYDVLSSRQVFSGNTVGQVSQLRDIAHAVSDAVFEKITGIPGIFSTKMVYVEDLGFQAPAATDWYLLISMALVSVCCRPLNCQYFHLFGHIVVIKLHTFHLKLRVQPFILWTLRPGVKLR